MTGLKTHIDDVIALHARAKVALRVEVVHDLRVAIRRCRSLAQGLREVDDDDGAQAWKAFSDAGRGVFQGLGELRDAQVMQEHVDALLQQDAAHGAIASSVLSLIASRKEGARAAVHGFDVDVWKAAAYGMPEKADALLIERALFDHLALRRFHEAKELHQAAMRSKASTALHELRIGVKKLRYTIENFLPDAHEAVGKVLKKMQELLGDIHDLDVLVDTLASEHVRLHSDDRSRVTTVVRRKRDELVADYRALTLVERVAEGDGETRPGAWVRVRAALAQGPQVPLAHEALMLRRSKARGVTTATARALERSAHVLLHAFRHERALKPLRDPRVPSLVRWVCACASVDAGGLGKLLRRLPLAVGFGERERALLDVIARAVFGAVPSPSDEEVLALAARDRALAVQLGAVMHLAAALSSAGPFLVKRGRDVVVIHTSRPLADARAFAEARAPVEALVGAPLWWAMPSTVSRGSREP